MKREREKGKGWAEVEADARPARRGASVPAPSAAVAPSRRRVAALLPPSLPLLREEDLDSADIWKLCTPSLFPAVPAPPFPREAAVDTTAAAAGAMRSATRPPVRDDRAAVSEPTTTARRLPLPRAGPRHGSCGLGGLVGIAVGWSDDSDMDGTSDGDGDGSAASALARLRRAERRSLSAPLSSALALRAADLAADTALLGPAGPSDCWGGGRDAWRFEAAHRRRRWLRGAHARSRAAAVAATVAAKGRGEDGTAAQTRSRRPQDAHRCPAVAVALLAAQEEASSSSSSSNEEGSRGRERQRAADRGEEASQLRAARRRRAVARAHPTDLAAAAAVVESSRAAASTARDARRAPLAALRRAAAAGRAARARGDGAASAAAGRVAAEAAAAVVWCRWEEGRGALAVSLARGLTAFAGFTSGPIDDGDAAPTPPSGWLGSGAAPRTARAAAADSAVRAARAAARASARRGRCRRCGYEGGHVAATCRVDLTSDDNARARGAAAAMETAARDAADADADAADAAASNAWEVAAEREGRATAVAREAGRRSRFLLGGGWWLDARAGAGAGAGASLSPPHTAPPPPPADAVAAWLPPLVWGLEETARHTRL